MGNKCNCCKGSEESNSKCCGCFNCNCCEGDCSCNCFGNKKRNQNINQIAPYTERQIAMHKYSSTYDNYFKDIEGKYNILTYIQLIDYINLLEYYSLDTATLSFNNTLKTEFSSKDVFLNQPMSIDHFQSFIENKLYRIPEIYEMWGNNEIGFNIFKTAVLEIHKSLELKLNQHYGDKIDDRIKKRNLIPLGVLYCVSNVVSKIKLIFDLFKNENGLFYKSNELYEYLLSSFLISSYCMVSARKKVGSSYSNISELNKEEIIQMIQVSELKDCQNLVNVFNNSFFDKDGLNWEEYRNKFETADGFQWILTSKGIRRLLEQNNV